MDTLAQKLTHNEELDIINEAIAKRLRGLLPDMRIMKQRNKVAKHTRYVKAVKRRAGN